MQQQSQEQDLIACISPVINALSPLKLKQSTELELNDFREQLLNSFDEFERNCYAQQVTTSAMQEVKFALTAMCDEFVMLGCSFSYGLDVATVAARVFW